MIPIFLAMFLSYEGTVRQDGCEQNLRQLGQAFSLYSHDYDDTLPATEQESMSPVPQLFTGEMRHTQRWMEAIRPYAKTDAVFARPGKKSRQNPHTSLAYGMNPLISGLAVGSGFDTFHAILLGDCRYYRMRPGSGQYSERYLTDTSVFNAAPMDGVHGGGQSNILFLDGHSGRGAPAWFYWQGGDNPMIPSGFNARTKYWLVKESHFVPPKQ